MPEAQYQGALSALDLLSTGKYENGELYVTLTQLINAATNGSSEAAVTLRDYYLSSTFFTHSDTNAQDTLRGAPPNAEVEYLLGISYIYFVPTQPEAIRLIEESASNGWPPALRDAGLVYQLGRIVPSNQQLAHKYLVSAAVYGDRVAKCVVYVPTKASSDDIGAAIHYAPFVFALIKVIAFKEHSGLDN